MGKIIAFSRLFLIGSFSNLPVTMTCIIIIIIIIIIIKSLFIEDNILS